MNICKECTNRHIGCHGKCSDYKKWRKEYEKQKRQANKIKARYSDYFYHG